MMVRCHRGDSGGGKGSTYQSCDGKQQAFVMIIASGQDVAVTSLFHVRLATQLFHVGLASQLLVQSAHLVHRSVMAACVLVNTKTRAHMVGLRLTPFRMTG